MASPRPVLPAPGTERLRLAHLLVGLSRVADIGMGLEPGEAARAAVIAARLARAMDAPEPSDVYYTALLQHVGCTAYAHEAAALLGGDEIAVKAAAARTDFGDIGDVLAGYLPSLAPDADVVTRVRAAGVAALRSKQITAGYSRANCEVAARTAARIGLGAGVQRSLMDMFEGWNGKGTHAVHAGRRSRCPPGSPRSPRPPRSSTAWAAPPWRSGPSRAAPADRWILSSRRSSAGARNRS
jgi:hypothetical protein